MIYGMEFVHSELLWLLLLVPVLFWMHNASNSRIQVSTVNLFRTGYQTWKQRWMFVPSLLFVVGFMAFVVASAGPRIPNKNTEIHKDGIAIMMVLDTSSSMLALDMSEDEEQTRLDVVKEQFMEFVFGSAGGLSGRSDDLIGVVQFAGFSHTSSPMTLDHASVAGVVKSIECVNNQNEDGTAIGDALTLAVSRLEQTDVPSKVILLLTDGANNAGDEDPLQAAELAHSQGITVYTIGVGKNGMSPIRITDPTTGRSMIRTIPSMLDEELLQNIANRTEGRYFAARSADALENIYQVIDSLEKTTITEHRYREYREFFQLFVLVGLCLVLASAWLEQTVWRREL